MKKFSDILKETLDLAEEITCEEGCTIEESYAAYQEKMQDLKEGRDCR